VAGPGWLNDIFAGVMVAVAVYSLGRIVAATRWSRPTHSDVDVAHVLMGSAMAGMLVTALVPVQRDLGEPVFAALALWFVWRCYRFVTEHGVEGRDEDHVHHLSHYLTHLVMAGSMVYMYLAAGPSATRSGRSMAMGSATGTTTDFVGIPLLFILVLFASGIWELDGIERFAPDRSDQHQRVMVSTVSALPRGSEAEPSSGADDNPRPPSSSQQPTVAGPWLAPRLEAGCHIAMCVTMGFMLVLML
jgi:Domain of unknown function (DUF5134)